jgi:hypothetical protein
LFCGFKISAQKRSIFLEIGGSGGLGSINFEKPFWIPSDYGPRFRDICGSPPYSSYYLNWRAGISVTPIDKNNGVALIFPLLVNWIYGTGNHKLEVGGGLAPTITTKGSFYVKSPLVLGYRFQPADKKLFYRVTYTPIIGWLVDFQWQHWAGISIGYTLP